VFLDDQEYSAVTHLEPSRAAFEVEVAFYTRGRDFFFFSHDCTRMPSVVEVIVTDGEHMTFRKRMYRTDFSIIERTRPRRIDLGHVRLGPPT